MIFNAFFGILWASIALAAPQSTVQVATPRPLVLWHGLGDAAQAKGVVGFMDEIKEIHPGIFTHAVYIMETEDEDRKAGFVSSFLISRFLQSCIAERVLYRSSVTSVHNSSSSTSSSQI